MAKIADPRDVIIAPVLSEKTYALMEQNTYTFFVNPSANKTQIKIAAVSYTHLTLPTNREV